MKNINTENYTKRVEQKLFDGEQLRHVPQYSLNKGFL